jgi:hypothetical protein
VIMGRRRTMGEPEPGPHGRGWKSRHERLRRAPIAPAKRPHAEPAGQSIEPAQQAVFPLDLVADDELGQVSEPLKSTASPSERRAMTTRTRSSAVLGMNEQELRDGLEQELMTAMRAEGNAPTLHAIAHSIARIMADDHLRMVEQLERAGLEFDPAN